MSGTRIYLDAPIVVVRSAHQYRAERWQGLDTGWRSLPETILETSCDGVWQVDFEGGALRVEAGKVFVIPAGVRHRLRALTAGGMRSTWLYLHWELANLPLRIDGSVGVLGAEGASAAVEALCGVVERQDSLLEKLRFQRLGLELLEMVMERYEVWGIDDPRLARAMEYAHKHFGGPVNRADLARAAGLSETRFHDLFREATGEAPVQFLNRMRLREAMFQLRYSDKPVGEVARACGFASDYYFSRFFKQKLGVSPRQFRQGRELGVGNLV